MGAVFCPACRKECPDDWKSCPIHGIDLLRSSTIGKYTVEGVIGVGGMGAVYRARNPDTGQQIALKVMKRDLAGTEARARFEREAKAVGALKTGHVVQIFDFGREPDGTLFLVMELLDGHPLRDEIQLPPSPMHLARVQMVMDGALKGLAVAHRAGIVHRDLKPENIFVARVDDGETPKLLDFGIAYVDTKDGRGVQLTQTGAMMGTASYMAPEQLSARAGTIGAWTDVYAMGAIFYELLTGTPAFGGTTLTEVLTRVQHTEYTPLATARPGLPSRVYDVVDSCFASDARKRPQDAEAMRAALADVRLVEPGATIPAARLRGKQYTEGLAETAASGGAVRAHTPPPPERPSAPAMFAAMRGVIDDDRSVARLLEYFKSVSIAAGQILFRAGDDSTTLYLIESGDLVAEIPSDTGVRERVMSAGSVIGETGLYRKAKRSATVRARTASTLLELSASALANMQRDAPDLVTKFHQFVTASIAERMISEQTAPPPRPRARWPIALAGVLVAGGGVAAAVIATRPSGEPQRQPPPAPVVADAGKPIAADAAVIAIAIDAAPEAHLEMVKIAGGHFSIGGKAKNWLPATEVDVATFWIDRHEMTRAELEAALGDKLPPATHDKLAKDSAMTPARWLTWDTARAACDAVGKRLPTEPEWEVATHKTPNDPKRARLQRIDRGKTDRGNDLAAPSNDCLSDGPCDMLGGVSEWTAQDAPGGKVVRGASYRDAPDSTTATVHYRLVLPPDTSDNTLGFRCALSSKGSR